MKLQGLGRVFACGLSLWFVLFLAACGGGSSKNTAQDAGGDSQVVPDTNKPDTTVAKDLNTLPDLTGTEDKSTPDNNTEDTPPVDTNSCQNDGMGVSSGNDSNIQSINVDETKNLVFCAELEEDWFKFDVATKGKYHIELTYADSDRFYDIYVFKSDDLSQDIDNSLDGGSGVNTLTVTLDPGSYRVQFLAFQGAGNYTAKIIKGCAKDAECTGNNEYCNQDTSKCQPLPTTSGCNGTDDSYEVNISDSTAKELALTNNAGKFDAKICYDDADWFFFNFADGDKVTISFSCSDCATGESIIGLLRDEAGLEVVAFTGNQGDFDKITLFGLKGGKYFLEVLKDGDADAKKLVSYSIDVTVEKNAGCKVNSDCSATNPLKGKCDANTGVCGEITGDGKVTLDNACDNNADCVSGICTNFGSINLDPFTQVVTTITSWEGGRNVCSKECKTNADCSGMTDGICLNSLFGTDAICWPKCTTDSQCPYDPGFGDYWYCNTNDTVDGGKWAGHCVGWQCTKNDHCKNSSRGPICKPTTNSSGNEVLACGCDADKQCQDKCDDTAKTCKESCASNDAACMTKCDTDATECKAKSFCNTETNVCAKKECSKDDDCKDSDNGSKCNTNAPYNCGCKGDANNCKDAFAQFCDAGTDNNADTDTCRNKECQTVNDTKEPVGCSVDSDCKKDDNSGAKCVKQPGADVGECSCAKVGDCARGTCSDNKCQADVNSDCTGAFSRRVLCEGFKCVECKDSSSCTLLGNPGGTICLDNQSCGCKEDSDCKDANFPACVKADNSETGTCAPCSIDAHCRNNSNPWTYVCINNFCEECDPSKPADNNECKGTNKNPETLGPVCDSNSYCVCDDTNNCDGNKYGNVCNTDWGTCGCDNTTTCANGTSCKTEDHPYFGDTIVGPPPTMCKP